MATLLTIPFEIRWHIFRYAWSTLSVIFYDSVDYDLQRHRILLTPDYIVLGNLENTCSQFRSEIFDIHWSRNEVKEHIYPRLATYMGIGYGRDLVYGRPLERYRQEVTSIFIELHEATLRRKKTRSAYLLDKAAQQVIDCPNLELIEVVLIPEPKASSTEPTSGHVTAPQSITRIDSTSGSRALAHMSQKMRSIMAKALSKTIPFCTTRFRHWKKRRERLSEDRSLSVKMKPFHDALEAFSAGFSLKATSMERGEVALTWTKKWKKEQGSGDSSRIRAPFNT